jgi:hypothetical protein
VDRIVTLAGKEKRIDLESLEMCIRSSMHGIGGLMLETLLNADGGGYRGKSIPCDNGHASEFLEYRKKGVMTVLGKVEVNRAYYYDRQSRSGMCPKDKDLDIEGTSLSPGVRRIMARVGAYRAFGLGHEDIKEMAGIDVTAKEIERICNKIGRQAEEFFDRQASEVISEKVIPIQSVPKIYVCLDGTGVPMVKKELLGRQGKAEDGQAKTREVKLGCVFTQTGLDEKGRPVRDEASTSYTGAIETAEDFGERIYAEAKRRGIDRAREIAVLGDGAQWIWNIADECFPGAVQIIDLYHAREYYWKAGRFVLDHNKEKLQKWAEKRRRELDNGDVEKVIEAIRQLADSTDYSGEMCEKAINYFEKNKERMRYNVFRKKGFFVGSGVLEAGCRSVIGQRLKQSGMHWSVDGANNIIALRCCFFSNRWEDFWEHRAA